MLLNVVKKCTTSQLENCVASSIKNLSGSRTNLNYPYWKWGSAFVLNNGISIWVFAEYTQNCTLLGTGYSDCSILYIDVNGLKEPNAFGKDIYAVHILPNGIKPFGSKGDWYGGESYDDCTPTDQPRPPYVSVDLSKNGLGCSAEYLYR